MPVSHGRVGGYHLPGVWQVCLARCPKLTAQARTNLARAGFPAPGFASAFPSRVFRDSGIFDTNWSHPRGRLRFARYGGASAAAFHRLPFRGGLRWPQIRGFTSRHPRRGGVYRTGLSAPARRILCPEGSLFVDTVSGYGIASPDSPLGRLLWRHPSSYGHRFLKA